MSEFSEQSSLSNQERAQLISSDATSESIFSIAQRFEIANNVAVVVRAIQMQQSTSSSTNETQSTSNYNQSAEYIKK
jgi:hypothetical protein